MPQLNPAPWFMILFISWMGLLSMLMKTIKHQPTNLLCYADKYTQPTTPWTWPW
uniref:ATP synthase complex subunit 8 n=1 Tax=Oscaecilia ochrocephala TaxID=543905 RepID=C9D8K2_OSCOC|nr:ATP synthase F0 subunit 8 [Oscaecilia ochrocephala]ACS37135.1 ATP synthase F0 subunit 8 [Oscaecilia ochrocephala]